MTHDKIINSLDSLIAQLNSFLLKNVNLWHLKNNIVMELKKIGVSPSTINSIRSIEIEDFSRNHLARQYYGSQEYEKMEKNAYTSTISTMINILKQEREAQVRAMQDEAQKENLAQQKRSNKIQIWTLICSIVAALAALYPIVKPLVEKIFN
jgi:hypothetical protein